MVKIITYENEVIICEKVEFAQLDYGKVIINEGERIITINDIKCIRGK